MARCTSRKLRVVWAGRPALARTVASETRELPMTTTVSGVVQAPGPLVSCAIAEDPATMMASRETTYFCIAEIYTNRGRRVLLKCAEELDNGAAKDVAIATLTRPRGCWERPSMPWLCWLVPGNRACRFRG